MIKRKVNNNFFKTKKTFSTCLIPQKCVCQRRERDVFAFTYHRLVSISPNEQSQEGSEDQLQKKAKKYLMQNHVKLYFNMTESRNA